LTFIIDAELKVTYSDGTSKTKTMKDAVRTNTVWYNLNPSDTIRALTVRGIYDTVKYENNQSGLDDTWPNLKGKTAPQITFYYRGYKVPYDVYVYNRLSGITATPKAGVATPIVANMNSQDNDNVGKNAKWLSEQIDVVATFSASSDTTKTRPLPLTYEAVKTQDDPDNSLLDAQEGKYLYNNNLGTPKYTKWTTTYGSGSNSGVAAGKDTYGGGPYVYSMDFGDPNWTWNDTSKVYEQGAKA